ncbi:MAG: hypothetical protein A2V77_05375 [Anaeromyxobacter sp. RBG_16_69_14]|nr:MAG: hypothetical protein A2V77_05375 [Anaeromyxobacter sp. RBG_16_69_14]
MGEVSAGSSVFSLSAVTVGSEVSIYAHDITLRVNAERALRDSEHRFYTVFHQSPFANGFTNLSDGTFADVNDEWVDLFGIPRLEAVGKTSLQLGIMADPEKHARLYEEARARGSVHVEMSYITRTRGIRIVQLKAHTVTMGGEQYLLGALQDITEQKRAEESLRQANERLRESDRRKDEFLGMLSHELRNPLAPIRSSVRILDRADPASDQAKHALTIIARQVDHLARLVDDLLDAKRISTGKLRLDMAPLDLKQAVRETFEDIRPVFMNRAVSLDLNLPEQAVWVNGDRTRLAQVVGNLLQNAAKFTDAGRHVSVTVESGGGQASIRVQDDGIGIPPEMVGALFEPFVQADRTLHRTTGGLGLGLSLVRGITELHGGAVAVRSGGVGKGAEFVVTLPTTEPTTEPVAATKGQAPAPQTGAKCRVLIIEDNVDGAESLGELIRMVGGHEVHLARDGSAGIAAAHQHAPDVILCDIGLPVMDGYEVARRIRASAVAPGARLIAISGYALAEDIDRAVRAGFDYHIAKPPDIDRVLALVAEAPSCRTCAPVPDGIATGHHEVDSQHASLLGALARLRAAKAEAVWESLRFLQQYTESHFQYEEALMEDVGYPDFAAHKQRHEDFLRQMNALQEGLERDGATRESLGTLADTVGAWVVEHVLDRDRHLAEFIRSQVPGQASNSL